MSTEARIQCHDAISKLTERLDLTKEQLADICTTLLSTYLRNRALTLSPEESIIVRREMDSTLQALHQAMSEIEAAAVEGLRACRELSPRDDAAALDRSRHASR